MLYGGSKAWNLRLRALSVPRPSIYLSDSIWWFESKVNVGWPIWEGVGLIPRIAGVRAPSWLGTAIAFDYQVAYQWPKTT